MSAEASESYVLCEGYYDRAFWKGWLMHLGCSDLGESTVSDPWNLPVRGGHFGFRSRNGAFVRVVPAKGQSNVLPAARIRLQERGSKALRYLIVSTDADVVAGDPATKVESSSVEAIASLVRSLAPSATKTDEGWFVFDGGETAIAVVRWEARDPIQDGLPGQQTLERLVSAAIVAAYPLRGLAVQQWLDLRPNAPAAGPKEYGWSYMAGWYAEHGCQDFYQHMWRDPAIADELEKRLRTSGVWKIAEALAT